MTLMLHKTLQSTVIWLYHISDIWVVYFRIAYYFITRCH